MVGPEFVTTIAEVTTGPGATIADATIMAAVTRTEPIGVALSLMSLAFPDIELTGAPVYPGKLSNPNGPPGVKTGITIGDIPEDVLVLHLSTTPDIIVRPRC